MPPQQATTGLAPMEGVERTNVVVVRGQRQEMSVIRRECEQTLARVRVSQT